MYYPRETQKNFKMQIFAADSNDVPWPYNVDKIDIINLLHSTRLLTQKSIEYYFSVASPFTLIPQSAGKVPKIHFGEKAFVPKPQNAEFLSMSLNRFTEKFNSQPVEWQDNYAAPTKIEEVVPCIPIELQWADLSFEVKINLFR